MTGILEIKDFRVYFLVLVVDIIGIGIVLNSLAAQARIAIAILAATTKIANAIGDFHDQISIASSPH